MLKLLLLIWIAGKKKLVPHVLFLVTVTVVLDCLVMALAVYIGKFMLISILSWLFPDTCLHFKFSCLFYFEQIKRKGVYAASHTSGKQKVIYLCIEVSRHAEQLRNFIYANKCNTVENIFFSYCVFSPAK